jgi:hypothetical protein
MLRIQITLSATSTAQTFPFLEDVGLVAVKHADEKQLEAQPS